MYLLKNLVYTRDQISLNASWDNVQNDALFKEYPNLAKHLKNYWNRRTEWAYSYRAHLPLRGTHTTAILEAGFRIIKDLIFARVKAYNLVHVNMEYQSSLIFKIISVQKSD